MKIILKKPVITEKAIDSTASGYYTLEVELRANKHQIKEAVETLFNVTVEDVRTITRKGREKRVGKTRRLTKTSPTKRAIVKVKKGQTIDLFTTPVDAKDEKKEKKDAKTKDQKTKKTKEAKKDKKDSKKK